MEYCYRKFLERGSDRCYLDKWCDTSSFNCLIRENFRKIGTRLHNSSNNTSNNSKKHKNTSNINIS